jgi:hypothetical protein
MTDNARRIWGLIIAPFLIMVGFLLFIEGVWHGKLSEAFWIGPFLEFAGVLWLATDWFDF